MFLKIFFWHVFEVFGWVSGGYLELSGFPECFFGGFHPFFGPEWVQKQGASRGPGTSRVKSRVFFDLKTPKNGQKKYLKCPKQVGMDSQDLPGVGLCPSSCHDVEILLFFLIFLSKNGHFTQHGQNRQKATFSLFFCIFSYSESPLAWIFGSQGVSDPFLGGYEGWFVGTLRGSPKKSKCLTRPEGFAPT